MQKEIIFPMKIGIIQHQCVKEVEKNLSHIETGIREAAQQGAQLVVLQELHNSLYFCQTENTNNFDLAESIPGPSTEKFGELAKELNSLGADDIEVNVSMPFSKKDTPMEAARKMMQLSSIMKSSTSPLATSGFILL